MPSTNNKHLETSKEQALRDLEYAMSLAIRLLSELDNTRAQIRTLKIGQDGRMIVSPTEPKALPNAVLHASRTCSAISSKPKIET